MLIFCWKRIISIIICRKVYFGKANYKVVKCQYLNESIPVLKFWLQLNELLERERERVNNLKRFIHDYYAHLITLIKQKPRETYFHRLYQLHKKYLARDVIFNLSQEKNYINRVVQIFNNSGSGVACSWIILEIRIIKIKTTQFMYVKRTNHNYINALLVFIAPFFFQRIVFLI